MVLLQSSMVPLGTPMPDFNLKGIDGREHSPASHADKKVLVVVFMCNHCPYVQKIWDDLVTLEKHLPEEVQFLGINPKGQEFPYLLDETQTVAKAFQATCTPDIFVFDEKRKLAYRGAFEGLEKAINALLNGENPSSEQIYSMGCSLKWN